MARVKPKRRPGFIRQALPFYLMLVPFMVVFVLFMLLPVLMGVGCLCGIFLILAM